MALIKFSSCTPLDIKMSVKVTSLEMGLPFVSSVE